MKCPKCGFKNPETSQECLKCGIVFSKLKANPKNETKIYYRAEISHSETSFFHYMIWPIAWAKVLVGQVFNRIIEMIWRELIGDKTAYSQLTSLIAVFIFSAFSITIYRFRAYDDLIIFVLLLIWCIDYSVAKFLDLQGKKVERINLTRNNRGQLIYKRTNIDGEPEEMAFNGGEVNLITIDRDVRLGGAFKEVMGNLWRIRLSFTEGYNLLLDEQDEIVEALKKAKNLAGRLNVPVKILNSEGRSPLVPSASEETGSTRSKKHKVLSKKNIGFRERENRFRIYSKWTWGNFGTGSALDIGIID